MNERYKLEKGKEKRYEGDDKGKEKKNKERKKTYESKEREKGCYGMESEFFELT